MPTPHHPKTPAWPPRSAPRLFVEDQLGMGRSYMIEGNQAHYLGKVMRLQPDDAVILCDNQTGEWAAKATEIGKRRITVEVAQHLRPREDVPDIWLCPALLKKDRFDLVLEKATELGAAHIQPVITRRCVANKLNLSRAQTIITEAAEQCARTALPTCDAPVPLDALLKTWPADRTLFFADELGGEPASKSFSAGGTPAAILIGPEGGFDDAERELLLSHKQVKPISLGPRILRGETAALAALSLWLGTIGDWNDAK